VVRSLGEKRGVASDCGGARRLELTAGENVDHSAINDQRCRSTNFLVAEPRSVARRTK
jgi:hypothetical protein